MNRREWLRLILSSSPVLALSRPKWLGAADASFEAKLAPVRQITRGPRFHWFGYYDKFQFSSDNRFVLANSVDFEHRSPQPDDAIQVGIVDLEGKDHWTEIGTTRAWNWQQGCMLQWLPGSSGEVIWNEREGDRFVACILDVKSGRKRTLSNPVYNISPDGRFAIAPDFRRLNDCRPGYGYTGIADPNKERLAPEDSGIWRTDLDTGKTQLLFSVADAVKIPFTGPAEAAFGVNSKHWFNHLLFNTDGSRFFFLHRWRKSGKPGSPFHTRAFTCDLDGKDWYCVDPHGRTSHFIWRDPQHIMAWAWHPSHGEKFYLYRDQSEQVTVVAPDEMPLNGHNTYLPQSNNEWVLNDTYPDAKRYQHPYLFHLPTKRKLALGHFFSPPAYSGEWRCDNHPRASRDGKLICIDSPHNGGRQMYLLDVTKLI